MTSLKKLLNLIPYYRRKNYNKMINDICIEVSEKKILDFFFSIPQEERDEIFLKSFDFTKPD
jgi:hypothetical protein